jgi:hypothetical protein
MSVAPVTCPVNPARFRWGAWCHRSEKTIGEGDIVASYSADRIGMSQPIRKPFEWRGSLWVCVSLGHSDAEAYRLTHPQAFKGEPVSYSDKTCDAEAARQDPDGFYHGMTVKHGGRTFVLSGPPALLVPGESGQMDLFGAQS